MQESLEKKTAFMQAKELKFFDMERRCDVCKLRLKRKGNCFRWLPLGAPSLSSFHVTLQSMSST